MMSERVNPIRLTDEKTGEKYELEFSRETIKFAEQRGFKIGSVADYPLSIYDLFFYAFRKNHKNVARDKTDKIIDEWGGITHLPTGLVERLGELYMQGFETLADEETRKNATVKIEF